MGEEADVFAHFGDLGGNHDWSRRPLRIGGTTRPTALGFLRDPDETPGKRSIFAGQRFSQSANEGGGRRLVFDLANNCGPGGATLFCQNHGFQRALSWDVTEARHTYVIGANRFCDASFASRPRRD
jgi:hypothetical protein